MSLNPTRREVLIGTAAVAATVATPGAAIAKSLVEQAEFAAIRFPMWDLRGMLSALSVLEHCAGEAGLSPEIYGEDISRALRYCVFAGWVYGADLCPLLSLQGGEHEDAYHCYRSRSSNDAGRCRQCGVSWADEDRNRSEWQDSGGLSRWQALNLHERQPAPGSFQGGG
jgi:hypothetical protein